MQKAKKRPKTDKELREYLRDVMGLTYPTRATREDHCSPFDFISDVWFERVDKALIRANRGGSKTNSFAALCVLKTVHMPGYDIVYIGGSEEQSKQGYAYYAGDPDKEGFTGYMRRQMFSEFLAGDPMVTKTALTNGSRLEIRTGGSDKSVSGPHPHVLFVDELDHIKLSTLNTALQMPVSKGAYGSQTIMGSSQYAGFGTMQTMLETADERGIKVYEYDVFDVLQGCGQRYNSPTCKDCPLYDWTNPYTGERELLCKGRGARADGFYSYKDACDKMLLSTDMEAFALQMLLMRGVSQGLVYGTFNEDRHVKSFPPPGADLSKWRCFGGVDLRSHGRVIAVAEAPGVLKSGKHMRWIIGEWADDNSIPSKIRSAAFDMREMVRIKYGLDLNVFWMERSASDEAADWQRLGLNGRTIPKEVGHVLYRIGQIRDALFDTNEVVSLKVDPECQHLIKAMSQGYHCKRRPDNTFDRDKPDEPFSHSPDALGYAYVGGPVGTSRLPEHDSRPNMWETEGASMSKWARY